MSHDSSDDDIPGLASLSGSEVRCWACGSCPLWLDLVGKCADSFCIIILQAEDESDDFSSDDADPDVEDEGPRPPHCTVLVPPNSLLVPPNSLFVGTTIVCHQEQTMVWVVTVSRNKP